MDRWRRRTTGVRRMCVVSNARAGSTGRLPSALRQGLLDGLVADEDVVHLCLEDALDLGVRGAAASSGDLGLDLREDLVELLVARHRPGHVHDVRVRPGGNPGGELAVLGVHPVAFQGGAGEVDEGHRQLRLVLGGLLEDAQLGAAEVGAREPPLSKAGSLAKRQLPNAGESSLMKLTSTLMYHAADMTEASLPVIHQLVVGRGAVLHVGRELFLHEGVHELHGPLGFLGVQVGLPFRVEVGPGLLLGEESVQADLAVRGLVHGLGGDGDRGDVDPLLLQRRGPRFR